MSGWGQSLATAALLLGLAGGAQASPPPSPGEGAPTAGANSALAVARSLGLPAGVLGAGGVLWLLFSQGKTLQENAEAWGKLSRRLRGPQSQGSSPPAARTPRGAGSVSLTGPSIAPGPPLSGRRFAVGFSYAGEERAVVAPIAEQLAQRLTEERVLYDKFHEAELARPDLDVYLPQLYRDHTELIVVVLSPDYPKKRWCGLEWRWIRQLILSEAQERIMLLRIGNPGDLSELGILSGDGYLDITHRPPEAVADTILERMAQQGIGVDSALRRAAGLLAMPADPADGSVTAVAPPVRRWPRRMALAGGAAAVLTGGWWAGRLLLAPWQLQQGDQAFLAYAKLADERQLQRADQAWRQAKALDPKQPEAHARLGFLADILGNLPSAADHWRRAASLTPKNTPQAQVIRNGLANVLVQQPGQRQTALEIYDADRFYPRSALEAAMQRWSEPDQMPQALDAISERALGDALTGDGPAQHTWGFKENGALLLFESRAHQRCLLASVQAATAHLAGANPGGSPPLTSPDCQGVQASVRDLLCSRLASALANPRAFSTAAWLGCPKGSQAGSAKARSA